MVNLIKSNKNNTLKSISNILDTVVDKSDYKLELKDFGDSNFAIGTQMQGLTPVAIEVLNDPSLPEYSNQIHFEISSKILLLELVGHH